MLSGWRPRLWWVWPAAVGFVLLLQLWFPRTGTGVLHDTYSPTAEGERAFYRLVEEHAGWTERNLQPLDRILPRGYAEPTLCILGPKRFPTPREWDAILDWVAEGGELLFAFRGLTEETIPRLSIRYVPRSGATVPNDALPPETSLTVSRGIAWWTDGRLVAPNQHTLVKYDDTVQAVSGTYGSGRYVICASSLVFSNQLLTYGDNSVLAMRLLEVTSDLDGVTFDESLNLTGTPKVVGLLFDRELRPLTLQLILLTLLYGWWNFLRFGPWLQPAVGRRQNIVDHTDALGVALWRARGGQAAVRAYWRYLQRSLTLRLDGKTGQARIDTAAARLGWNSQEVRELLETTARVAESQPTDRRRAAGLIRRLARFQTALQRQSTKSGRSTVS